MKLLTTREFNGVALDCYEAEKESDGFWATREQIGRLLGYKNPATAIKNIHKRKASRLDKFSRVAQIELPTNKTQDAVFYNFKGFLEICRFSNQPKANAVMDFAWEVMDEIRRTGTYNSKPKRVVNPDNIFEFIGFEGVRIEYVSLNNA
ncbi:MAG: hypothetical protein IJ859_13195 [Synergistaceae bacterium]|nr:hypothetical protein [Synergistaceae bacterium]